MPHLTGRRVAVLALAVAALSPATAAEGAVGADLTASVPPAQAVLTAAPREVTLTFSAVPDVDRSHLAVVDERGRRVSSPDEPTLRGATLSQSVEIVDSGVFTIVYHVEFTDGAETDGWRRFSVGTGRVPPTPSQAERDANADLVTSHQHGVDPISAVLLVVNALVIAGVVVLLRLTRPAAQTDAAQPRRLFRMPEGWSDADPPGPDGSPRTRS
ncbi:copper resistance protein CopC [Micromonospora sp. WMMD882]|uniref:copper resistance CopC family protein n=1 Tax=Micromonospora sp. WMMD882 TaxID=3015151 RepID=UPI00248CA979|nr:copper resistance CopC family protein [Micromonospora sp. WMMD882]WBB80682.1 copper resistance protein CopC [Micromonospora sp. WMMD882]